MTATAPCLPFEMPRSAMRLGKLAASRLLFLFTRHPCSMYELNAKLLALPLAILDLNGSYETDFNESEARQWPSPNVLGVAKR
jgi:hypothetical protein